MPVNKWERIHRHLLELAEGVVDMSKETPEIKPDQALPTVELTNPTLDGSDILALVFTMLMARDECEKLADLYSRDKKLYNGRAQGLNTAVGMIMDQVSRNQQR